jgi:hypothetical protein
LTRRVAPGSAAKADYISGGHHDERSRNQQTYVDEQEFQNYEQAAVEYVADYYAEEHEQLGLEATRDK